MKKRVLIPTLMIATLLIGGQALAGPGFGGGNCGAGKGVMTYEQHEERVDRRLEMMTTVLELSDDQQGQIESILDQKWQDKQEQREAMQATRNTLHELRTAETFNEAEFRTAITKHNELKTEMMVDREKTKQQLYAILTPEQQEKAETLRGLMGGKGGRHGGKGFRF